MERIKDFPGKAVIGRWLKAGYGDNNVFNRTEKGSGQGSVISPLLANVTLHRMEEQPGIKYKTFVRKDGYNCAYNRTPYAMSKYADDFVIMCKSKEDAESIYDKLKPYLKVRGLELEPSRTRVVEITEGFDFLSFNKVSRRLFERLHPKKSAKWISDRYHKTDFEGKSKNK